MTDDQGNDRPSAGDDRFLFRGPTVCRARRPLVVGILLGLAIAALAITTNG